MINFAHRGASFDYPENTMLALKEGIKSGANGLEIDVHKTKDNKLVVIHDEDVERTYLGKGLVKDLTLNELRKLKNRKKLFRDNRECIIPTLEEILGLINGKDITLNIELKTDEIHYKGIEEDVISLINEYKLNNQIILSSFNHNSIKIVKSLDSSIKTGILYDKPIEDVIKYAKELDVDAIHPDLRFVSRELIEEAHENNLKVNIYTVNMPIYMRLLIKNKADGLFTDYPELLSEILKEEI
ncbi:MAG: glycerophosphodiester phosphodiesterase [Clostridium sp.]|jgi:glycerophosphoryl diester phosphodiesterase|uniref:glycerophosphodiester phosphodiesterase n=1 Tax=Clostridium TaxID=1485 RepID=UPI000BE387F6|nr:MULTISPECIES: glycerophosphodiester phosphodiesterase [Clostridium]MBU6136052.1 glycerophosphodiester phosphodiesterase [Clostridium tertium]MDU1568314.1 glycerophosphodiester phosphodiesterase [Clostridium sp.]MDU2460912.1 glycerophosphodiester phosphodiesterase [Clostridium sp.]MDU3351889.1 glycerophosphodiester phosphodiesterase [Clostridium sp.]MDU3408435.1 glycerophosphodiester phosphodiesterase [Clostridium sp.]